MPIALFDSRPRVAQLRLQGLIAARASPLMVGGLSLASVGPLLDRAFGLRRLAGVILAVNSPGGSAVQSSLIAGRIRRLAEEKRVPVIACVEDAAASGGYWIACAADEIVVDPASVVGSIGVISQGFGLQEVLARWGVERRLRTAGEEKSFLDPFRPQDPRDEARLAALLAELHEEFKAWVRARRGARLKAPEDTVFTGRFWTGRRAVELGLADALGSDPAAEAKRRFGERIRVVPVGARRRPFPFGMLPGTGEIAEGVANAVAERAAWGRLGL